MTICVLTAQLFSIDISFSPENAIFPSEFPQRMQQKRWNWIRATFKSFKRSVWFQFVEQSFYSINFEMIQWNLKSIMDFGIT